MQYTRPENLTTEFITRGLVALSPESLGISTEIHEVIYESMKKARREKRRITAALIPDVLTVIDSPGVRGACEKLLGKDWAIVPFTHNAPYATGAFDQWWHKDDNGPYNMRKMRQHQAIQVELLYYPQDVDEDMGPTAIIPYSQYWTFNHEENHDNFAGADHLDFGYIIEGMDKIPVSGEESKYDIEEIRLQKTLHDERMRDAVSKTGWPLAKPFELGPLRAGTVVLASHNLFHRGNHRRDDWRNWQANPRYMWRLWLYRTTQPEASEIVDFELSNPKVDPMTSIDLGTDQIEEAKAIWRFQTHWIHTGGSPPKVEGSVEDLSKLLVAEGDSSEPIRLRAAYELAGVIDEDEAIEVLSAGLLVERESVRRAATYGLIALGEASTLTFQRALTSSIRWVRKAGAFGLGVAGTPSLETLEEMRARLLNDNSVSVRSVAAEAIGCIARRAAGTKLASELLFACCDALVDSLEIEENRVSMDVEQDRHIKFVRPTDESDICEGIGVDYREERFEKVRSAVRENALWSMVILTTHYSELNQRSINMLESIVKNDTNVFAVGLAMDSLNRAGLLSNQTLQESPILDYESLSRTKNDLSFQTRW